MRYITPLLKSYGGKLPETYRENLYGDLTHFALNNEKFPEKYRIKKMSSSEGNFLFHIII